MTLGVKFEALIAGKPVKPLKGTYGLNTARLVEPIRRWTQPLGPVIDPFTDALLAVPPRLRIPVVGGAAYGIMKLSELLSRH